MRFNRVPYLDFAKEHAEAALSLANSNRPHRNLSELVDRFSLDPAALMLQPEGKASWFDLGDSVAATYDLARDQVLPVGSTSLGNFLALTALLDQRPESKREVLFETPTYAPLLQQAKAAGGAPRSLVTWQEGRLDPQPLIDAIGPATAAVVITNLQNPTGRLYPTEAIKALAEQAAAHDASLLVDEVYRGFLDTEIAPPAVHAAPNVISIESFSKLHGLSNLRIGWALGPPKILQRMIQINDHLAVHTPYICQDIACQMIAHIDELVAEGQALAASRRSRIEAFFMGRQDISWFPPDGGLIGVARPHLVTPRRLHEVLLERYQTIVTPGDFFGLPDYLRIGFGGPRLDEALERFGHCLDELAS